MLKVASSLACLTLVVSLAYVQAEDTNAVAAKCGTAKCEGAQCATAQVAATQCATSECGSCQSCPIAKAMENLPQLTYAVGTERTCCAESAADLSTKHNKPIQFVVGDKTYDSQQLAMGALADETEAFVNAFAEPKVCSESGTTTVAGKQICCNVAAEATVKLVNEAMAKVAMTYQVGDKQCDCPAEASTLAKEDGKSLVYLVNGESTPCQVTARLKLARAKYRAAVEALTAADAQAGEADQS